MELRLKRICILIRTLNPGGAEKQSLMLAKALNNKYDITLVVQKGQLVDNNYVLFVRENNINLILLKGIFLIRFYRFYRILKTRRIQIIFSYLTSDNFWCAIGGTLARVKYLIGGIRSELLPWHKFYITRLLHRYCLDFIVFNSNAGQQAFINKGFSLDKTYVIKNCFEISAPLIVRPEKKEIKILSVGRFVQAKDYNTAIRAFHFLIYKLIPEISDIEYLIIGFGERESQIRKQIFEYNLSDKIKIIIKPDNLHEYFMSSDIYLSTSIFEGFSNSILEAMNFSLPVIATDVGDNSMIVRDEVTGFLAPVKAYEEIALRILELVKSYTKRISFGLAGHKLLEEEYTMKNFQNNYYNFISSLEIRSV
jgi:glycosyltransferase involved in cell wall biosynthesis